MPDVVGWHGEDDAVCVSLYVHSNSTANQAMARICPTIEGQNIKVRGSKKVKSVLSKCKGRGSRFV